MRYLLDTHVLIWWRQDDPRLPHRWDAILHNPDEHEILFSVVSIWEIAIKRSIGKLTIEGTTTDFARSLVTDHGFLQMPLQVHEICRTERLPQHHRDLFDRLLIAQCLEAGAIALTDDPSWPAYGLRCEF